jgi:predicted nucleic acid-binding Zn ribbon protein
MVEFCTVCGTSLPKGDLTVKGGKVFTSPDYDCPSCHKPANPDKSPASENAEVEPERDLVFKKGIVKSE